MDAGALNAGAIPRATYRLQLNAGFGFRAAADLVPYLERLGVSHCYFSPYLRTRPGSVHGYDVVDHDAVNPELGEEADHTALCERLRNASMGQVLDIVPNHVGVMGSEGKWWQRVLENGQATRYADFFDIDWQPATQKLKGKVLVPVLGDQYGKVLAAGELVLELDAGAGELSVWYHDHRFPVDPSSYPALITQPGDGRPEGAARADLIALESILRSLARLPDHESADEVSREVRAHEIFIAKRRLVELCARSPAIKAHIERRVAAVNGTAGDAASFAALHALLDAQPYRLSFWRVAADEINYRRFFDINDLAGIRTQNEEVLVASHRMVLSWAAQGKIQGFRIDHPDGLYDPLGYFHWLRARLAEIGRSDQYLVVEKILATHEHVPRGWPVHGTTGYEFAVAVNGLFVYGPGEEDFDAVYRNFTRERAAFDDMLARAKREILSFHLSSELTMLANHLSRLAEARLETRDFTLNAMRAALLELLVAFPVYRTYVTPSHIGVQDRAHLEWAIEQASKGYERHDEGLLELIGRLLLADLPADADESYRRRAAEFTAKFQQVTGPVMAKSLEDTCFYRYVRLLSLNDVGGDPRRFGVTPAAFHRLAELRKEHWPHSMLATSTHDSKRSEDVRARLNVLSELPEVWRERLDKWRRFNRAKRRRLGQASVPSRAEEYFIYQTLVGSWPTGQERSQAMTQYRERIEAYVVKAARESKASTSWAKPNADYEERLIAFVRDVLAENGARNPFVDDLDDFVGKIARFGFENGLAQTLLKLASPGVPDIYQGNELWDFSLVDPDNRRPVDYALRARLLSELEAQWDERAGDAAALGALARELRDAIGDGRAKLFLTWRTLRCRAERPDVFTSGDYLALEPSGARAEHVCAFARRHEGVTLIAAVGRWFATLANGAAAAAGGSYDWGDTAIALPAPGAYRSVLTGRTLVTDDDARARAAELFADFPVALLIAA
jgi:(1->4)-alpha-D-glucan 1-alpha-D-glucosylmutase